MDLATLVMTHNVLACAGVREAGRRLERPANTVSAALRRFEEAVGVPLIRRAGAASFLTLEARRMQQDVAIAARSMMRMIVPQMGELAAEKFSARSSITLTALSRFTMVAEAGSIRRAARAINLGQPQLSQQIARLEAQIGASLLTRSGSGVRLTPAGRRIAAQLPAIESRLRRLAGRSSVAAGSTRATIRLATAIPLGHDSSIAGLMARLAAAWHRRHRKQPLFITSGAAEDLFAGLKDKRFDLALADSEIIPDGLVSRPLSSSPIALVGRRALVGGTQPTRTLLRASPLALPGRRTGLGQAANRLLEALLAPEEIALLDTVEMDSIPVIGHLMTGFGYLSLLPQSAISQNDRVLATRAIEPQEQVTLSLVWSKSDPGQRAARQLLAVLRDLQDVQQTV